MDNSQKKKPLNKNWSMKRHKDFNKDETIVLNRDTSLCSLLGGQLKRKESIEELRDVGG